MSQQISLFNTYSLDPLQLNIAYAGASCTEANIHYRTQWIGMQNTPKLLQLNAHTALGKSNALALRVNSQTQGLLNTLGATIGYAYRIKVSETAKVHLGLGIGFTQAALLAQKAIVIDGNDAALNNSTRQTANGFDSEFGAMFVGSKLKLGVAALHLYNSNPNFAGNSSYKALPQLNSQVSYVFNKDKKLEVEPWILSRNTIKGDNVIEGMLNFNFAKTITVGAGYRVNYGFLALLGAKIGALKLGYSFDYTAGKNATNLGTSHQVMLGFNTCKNTKKIKPVEEPVVVNIPPPPVVAEPTVAVVEPPVIKEVVPEPVVEAPKAKTEQELEEDLNQLSDAVIFDLNKSTLNSEGLTRLDNIANFLKSNPNLKVNVVGHACNIGDKAKNDLLSKQRATYVRNELIKRGVDSKNLLQIIGVGAEQELYNNNTSDQPKNRTVRFQSVK